MKKYINAELEIILYNDDDVIVTSGESETEENISPVKGPDLPDNWY